MLASLQETYLATMKSLAVVIEAKDLDHERPSRPDAGLRTRARSPDRSRRSPSTPTLGYGFFLHDIGKVGIPEHILCKAGPLTVDEWTVMRNHPIIGAQIVGPIAFLADTVVPDPRTTTSGSTEPGTRTVWPTRRSRSRPGSSRSPTRSMR